MHYFISTREDYNTSAIELAQVKRMHIFDALGLQSRIVEIQKNDFSQESQEKLGTQNRVINLFAYYQYLSSLPADTEQVLAQILEQAGLTRRANAAYYQNKAVIQAHLYNHRLFYVDYLDQYGFTVKRQFFAYNHLSYTEYFDDQAHLMMREFVNNDQKPVIHEYFCQSQQKTAMLTLIELTTGGKTRRFNQIAELQAYFLDSIVAKDPAAVLYCDRSTQILPAFARMKTKPPRYVVLHSALTPSGYLDEAPYTVYQPIKTLTQQGKLNGVVSSTGKEARDVQTEFGVSHSYAIPVTYVEPQTPVPFATRKNGRLIAVARVDEVKQLDQLIKVVINLKKQYSDLSLSIYGNSTSDKENKRLQNLVAAKQAQNYIHFQGFAQNLDEVYNSAQLEVLTSKNEGFAMALVEAQAHGCPAVSYDINYGPKEIIQDGVSGKLVKANDVRALQKVIADLLSHKQVLAYYSDGAYQTAQRFDFAHIEEKWRQFLQREGLIDQQG